MLLQLQGGSSGSGSCRSRSHARLDSWALLLVHVARLWRALQRSGELIGGLGD